MMISQLMLFLQARYHSDRQQTTMNSDGMIVGKQAVVRGVPSQWDNMQMSQVTSAGHTNTEESEPCL